MTTTKRLAVLVGTSCLLALGACDRNEVAPADDNEQLRKGELPAEVAVRERIAQDDKAAVIQERREQATEERVEARTEARTEARAEARAEATDMAPARRAEAELDTVGNAKLDVIATFEEKSDGVAVLVRVEDAKPGTRSVRIYDRADCDDLEDEPLGKPFASSNKQGDLGSVTIGASGKGTLETKAFNTSLKPDDRESLLGKTIVVQERNASSAKGSGDAIACGVIRMDTELADKAGRMTDPITR
jgi:Cu/Zn superoxide dismutase